MLVKMESTSSIGGGTSGETEVITSTNQTVTINTGLPSVKRFLLYGYLQDFTPSYYSFAFYDIDYDPTLFQTATIYPSGGYTGSNITLGTAVSRAQTINSVNGGIVTITTDSVDSRYANVGGKFYWWAE